MTVGQIKNDVKKVALEFGLSVTMLEKREKGVLLFNFYDMQTNQLHSALKINLAYCVAFEQPIDQLVRHYLSNNK